MISVYDCAPGLGYGIQVSNGRVDDLDAAAIAYIASIASTTQSERRPNVLDIGCGLGVQSARMASAGATVFAIDHQDFGARVRAAAEAARLSIEYVKFAKADARQLRHVVALTNLPLHVVYCQRMLHYLRHNDAIDVLTHISRQTVVGGQLLLGISGLSSELAVGYEHREAAIKDRFGMLSPIQQVKHQIGKAVCLYTMEEARTLVESVGFAVTRVWESEFGNVKLVATRIPAKQ